MNDFPQMSQRFDPQRGGKVEFGDDSRLYVEFYTRSVRDEIASRAADRPVYKQVDYIIIQQPTERDRIDRPSDYRDVARFPKLWESYQAGRQDAPDGTPLAILFPNNPEIVENLKYDKIFVVEQLAGLTDTQIQNVGIGAREWSQRAQAFIKASQGGAGFQALAAEVEQLKANDKAKDDKIAALTEALDEATKKNRGKAA